MHSQNLSDRDACLWLLAPCYTPNSNGVSKCLPRSGEHRKMQQTEPSFNLPPMLTFLESTNGYHAVHSLDFDIVSVADSEDEAWRKLRIAVATYVEYGLNNGLKDYIVFNA